MASIRAFELASSLPCAGARVGTRTSSSPYTELATTRDGLCPLLTAERRAELIRLLTEAGVTEEPAEARAAQEDWSNGRVCECIRGSPSTSLSRCARAHPLEMPPALGAAVANGDVQAVRTWLDAGGHVDATSGSFGNGPVTTMLMLACDLQHPELVRALLAAGARVHTGTTTANGTAYDFALERVGEQGIDSPILASLGAAPSQHHETLLMHTRLGHQADAADIPWDFGHAVVVVGLLKREYNGMWGAVLGPQESGSGRVPVRFGEPLNKDLLLKAQNLCPLPDFM